mgnify:CR=1 FL=1
MACGFTPRKSTSITHTPSPLTPVENSLEACMERELLWANSWRFGPQIGHITKDGLEIVEKL